METLSKYALCVKRPGKYVSYANSNYKFKENTKFVDDWNFNSVKKNPELAKKLNISTPQKITKKETSNIFFQTPQYYSQLNAYIDTNNNMPSEHMVNYSDDRNNKEYTYAELCADWEEIRLDPDYLPIYEQNNEQGLLGQSKKIDT